MSLTDDDKRWITEQLEQVTTALLAAIETRDEAERAEGIKKWKEAWAKR